MLKQYENKPQYEQMCFSENNEKEMKYKIDIDFVKIALFIFVQILSPNVTTVIF